MPKSKRAKIVHLSQTDAKGREGKVKVVEAIRENLEGYTNLFLVEYENMRTAMFQKVRVAWTDSKFFMCKNSLIRIALGRTAAEEQRPGLHKLTADFRGNVGLLMTNKSDREVLEYFGTYGRRTYARAGGIASETVTLPAGIIKGQPFSNFETLKKLGLPISLQRAEIELLTNYTICEKGTVLGPEQCKLLKIFGKEMATFKINVTGFWNEDTGFQSYKAEEADAASS